MDVEEDNLVEKYGDLFNNKKLHSDIKSEKEKWKLIPAFLKLRGLVKQHIDSFNYFINVDIKKIVKAKSNCLIKSDSNPNFYLKYKDVRIGFPRMEEDWALAENELTPHECRTRDLTYSAPILVDIEYTKGLQVYSRKDLLIGRMPLMLGCTNCVLNNKSDKELSLLKECPYDPRGYFIVKGVEKVLLIHEQMSKNRIIVEYDSKGNVCASVTSSTNEIKSRTALIFKNGKVSIKHNSFLDEIPVCIMFKAFGIISDQEVFQLVGNDFNNLIIQSVQECYTLNIFNQIQAISFIASKFKSSNKYETKIEEVIECISSNVLSHVVVIDGNFNPKARYLALMIRRLFEGFLDSTKIDDKDYYGNKRLELGGQMISLLFEDLFKKFNSELKKKMDKELASSENADVTINIRPDTITTGLANAISTGNWTLKRFKMKRAGVTQLLNRLSYISALGMMTRINSQFEKTRKISGPRSLQPSQWGMICPSDTPEGESCGLVKNLALISHVTTEQPDTPIINLAINLGIEDINFVSGEEIHSTNCYLVYLNGYPLGLTKYPDRFCQNFRILRRKGLIHEFVNIHKTDYTKTILIASDSGRLTRPLIVVKNGIPQIKQKDLLLLEKNLITFKDLIQNGSIEFLDVNEQNDSLICLNEKDLKKSHTHLEIAPLTILGVVAGLIPYPHHNQSPRNTYQCAMGKQAIGSIGYNQLGRTDTVLYLMIYPQKPLVKTYTIELTNYDKLPAGQNASVAVMSYSGYDIEDAVILNKSSLDRGFGRVMVLKKHQGETKKFDNGSFEIRKAPEKIEKEVTHKKKTVSHFEQKYHAIDKDGLPFISSKLSNGDIFVSKFTPVNKTQLINESEQMYTPSPISYKSTNTGIVDRVMITSTPTNPELIKIITREVRRPELGDKFSSRHGQKGVVGLIVEQENMPFSEQGWCPDLIMNPHGYPSRMTVGKLIELVAGKSALFDGKLKYGTAFDGDSVDSVTNILKDNGFSMTGKDFLYDGITGEPVECAVYQGPIFYQRLKHMVTDKIHSRARGPKTGLTRQPIEGRAKEGGLRLGEMERDCLVGYGAACLLIERLMISSDLFVAYICCECGFLAYCGDCTFCGNGKSVLPIKIPYAFKLLTQELLSMNIKVKFNISST